MIEKKRNLNYASPEYSRPHAERGAEIIAEFLKNEGAEEKLIERVKMLVSKHEEGGNQDSNLLKDVDSVSFFENNIPAFLNINVSKRGKEKVKKKFDWMFNRITSKKAKEIAGPWHEDAIKKLQAN